MSRVLDGLLGWAQYALVVGVLAVGFGVSQVALKDSRTAAGVVSARDSLFVVRGAAAVRETCPGVQQAVGYYRRKFTAHRARMHLEGAPPRAWYPCRAARRRAVVWRDRAHAAALELAAWQRDQYQWQRWLPAKWYRVARCETGVNWSHDSGTYVSAFGIYRPGYTDDAHRVGNMGWDETVRARGSVPTPREQYEAALSHYRAHGGFAGWGCRSA